MKKTLKELTSNIDMVLFNTIIQIDDTLELEAWEEFYICNEEEEYKDIYQYFVINRFDWEYLSRVTKMPLYYSSVCDLYVLWIDFLDNWENVLYEV